MYSLTVVRWLVAINSTASKFKQRHSGITELMEHFRFHIEIFEKRKTSIDNDHQDGEHGIKQQNYYLN